VAVELVGERKKGFATKIWKNNMIVKFIVNVLTLSVLYIMKDGCKKLF
jgi:hypothetical protein